MNCCNYSCKERNLSYLSKMFCRNIQILLREWKALDEILAPTKPAEMDDLQVKLFVSFLRTYASYFS